jgi:hypothetical protein
MALNKLVDIVIMEMEQLPTAIKKLMAKNSRRLLDVDASTNSHANFFGILNAFTC